jgi:purine-nucleoside phosphorylase
VAQFDQQARLVADTLRAKLRIEGGQSPEVGIILGTGWGDLLEISDERSLPMSTLPGFQQLQTLEGHKRLVCYGTIGDKHVIALRGRVHINERPCHEATVLAVRMQVQMLVALGVKTFILTNAAGALGGRARVGDVVVVDGFVSLFAPDLPLFAGEFCSPDDALDHKLMVRALAAGQRHFPHEDEEFPRTNLGGYAMMRGPFFEGRKYDKRTLYQTGASCVGMSSLPEAAVIAALLGHEARVLVLSYITNSEMEMHSHEENVRRAKCDGVHLSAMLADIIRDT